MGRSKTRRITRRKRTRGSARTATPLHVIRASMNSSKPIEVTRNHAVSPNAVGVVPNAVGVLESTQESAVEDNATSPMYFAPIHNKVEQYQSGIAGPSNAAITAELQKRQANMEAAANKRPTERANLDSELNTLTRAEQAVKLLDKAREEAATLSENNAGELLRSAVQAAAALIGYGTKTGGSRKNKRMTHKK